jgi:hypothetical protein
MATRTGRVFCTLIACALTYAVPAAAADAAALAGTNDLHAGLTGRALSDEEMSNLRGRYIPPPGSTVLIQIGYPSTTYSQADPATPGSATVIVTSGGTIVRGAAATGGSVVTSLIRPPVSFGHSIGTSFKISVSH